MPASFDTAPDQPSVAARRTSVVVAVARQGQASLKQMAKGLRYFRSLAGDLDEAGTMTAEIRAFTAG